MPVGADLPPSCVQDEVGYIVRLFIIDIRKSTKVLRSTCSCSFLPLARPQLVRPTTDGD